MTAVQLLGFLAQTLYVFVFLDAAVQAIRRPRRSTLDIASLFGVTSVSVAMSWLLDGFDVRPTPAIMMLQQTVIVALPYLLLRLVDDFTTVPYWLLRGAEAGLGLALVAIVASAGSLPPAAALAMVAYIVVIEAYDAVAFVRHSNRTGGVTRRRMQAVTVGAITLGLLIVLDRFQLAIPALGPPVGIVNQLTAVVSGIAFFVGFAPPVILRRAWQEPELRAFLGRAAALPRLPSTDAIVAELERGAAASLGAPAASIGLWDGADGVLRFRARAGNATVSSGELIAARVFETQQPVFADRPLLDDPANTPLHERGGVQAVLVAPISAGSKRLGVLAVHAPHAPIFAEDDLDLVQLLADQAAVILEGRSLIDEAARVQAREAATRLRDDFLSAAAHDLKTPLTTIVAQAQLMERRASRSPDAPADLVGIQRIVQEAKRLNNLVLELLDVSRLEQGRLIGTLEDVDLVELASEVCERELTTDDRCRIEAAGPVVGRFDRNRVSQLLSNLVENAVKYSPGGTDIEVRVRGLVSSAEIAVSDRGIGIPPDDLVSIFDRFHRGGNVDDRRFAGMGLGLYICRGITEQHGGRIWATSPGPGKGSTFHVLLPLSPEVASSAPTVENLLMNA